MLAQIPFSSPLAARSPPERCFGGRWKNSTPCPSSYSSFARATVRSCAPAPPPEEHLRPCSCAPWPPPSSPPLLPMQLVQVPPRRLPLDEHHLPALPLLVGKGPPPGTCTSPRPAHDGHQPRRPRLSSSPSISGVRARLQVEGRQDPWDGRRLQGPVLGGSG